MLTDRAKEIVSGAEKKMQDALNFLEEDLKTYRVGKANPSIFNGLMVEYYGTPTPVHQVASIAAPDAKTLTLQPRELNGFSLDKAVLLTDGPDGQTPQQEPLTLDKKGCVTVTLQPQCAALIYTK